jgi:hypothetical protein
MQNDKLKKLFDVARSQNDLISENEVLDIIESKGRLANKSGNFNMYIISSFLIVLSLGAGYFSGMFNQSEIENKITEKSATKEILSSNEQPEIKQEISAEPTSDLAEKQKNEKPAEVTLAKAENHEENQQKKTKKKKTKQFPETPEPLKVQGLNPIELKPSELKNLGVTANDDGSLDFYALQKTSNPVKIHLTRSNHNMNFGVKDENISEFSPVFVTDANGNKRISLYNDDNKMGIIESFKTDGDTRTISRTNMKSFDDKSYRMSREHSVNDDGTKKENFDFDFTSDSFEGGLSELITKNLDMTIFTLNGQEIEMDENLKSKVNKAGLEFFKTKDINSAVMKHLDQDEVSEILSQVGLTLEDLRANGDKVNFSFELDQSKIDDNFISGMMKEVFNEDFAQFIVENANSGFIKSGSYDKTVAWSCLILNYFVFYQYGNKSAIDLRG